MYNSMEINTTKIISTSFYSHIRKNSTELVHITRTMLGNCKLGRNAAKFCDYIFL
jgi:hypothetical protein